MLLGPIFVWVGWGEVNLKKVSGEVNPKNLGLVSVRLVNPKNLGFVAVRLVFSNIFLYFLSHAAPAGFEQ